MQPTCAILEISKNKKPDFDAAEEFLNDMDDDEMTEVVDDIAGFSYEDSDSEEEQVQQCRDRLCYAFETVKSAWDNQNSAPGDILIYNGHHRMLIAIGDCEGDLDSVESMKLFKMSGMAKAAGFLEDVDEFACPGVSEADNDIKGAANILDIKDDCGGLNLI
jgi:hypothetical protein